MIDCLVFSRNRAAQLDLLLRSLRTFAPSLFDTVTVLYTHDPPHALAYQYLRQEHPRLFWWPQIDFEIDVRTWLDRPFTVRRKGLVSFLVDDDVFYRAPDRVGRIYRAPDRVGRIWLDGDLPFSLRAGDYDYPLSLDGVIYDPSMILDRLDFDFTDPTQLEAGLHVRRGDLEIQGHDACLVGVPANVVSPSSNNPHMGVDIEQLNERFLRGERIDLPATLAQLPTDKTPHMNVEYVWVEARDRIRVGELGA